MPSGILHNESLQSDWSITDITKTQVFATGILPVVPFGVGLDGSDLERAAQPIPPYSFALVLGFFLQLYPLMRLGQRLQDENVAPSFSNDLRVDQDILDKHIGQLTVVLITFLPMSFQADWFTGHALLVETFRLLIERLPVLWRVDAKIAHGPSVIQPNSVAVDHRGNSGGAHKRREEETEKSGEKARGEAGERENDEK
jgi:hypothetical protein